MTQSVDLERYPKLIAGIMILSLLRISALAQNSGHDWIDFEGIRFRLGMKREEVLKQSSNLVIKDVSGDRAVEISKGNEHRYTYLNIAFSGNGSVSYIALHVRSKSVDAFFSLLQELYEADLMRLKEKTSVSTVVDNRMSGKKEPFDLLRFRTKDDVLFLIHKKGEGENAELWIVKALGET